MRRAPWEGRVKIINPKATDITVAEDFSDVEFTLVGDGGATASFRARTLVYAELLNKLGQILRGIQVDSERSGDGRPLFSLTASDCFATKSEREDRILVGFEPNREQVWTHSISLETARKLLRQLLTAIEQTEAGGSSGPH